MTIDTIASIKKWMILFQVSFRWCAMDSVKVFDVVGSNAISIQSGTELFEIISPLLNSGKSVELDFEGVSIYASPFFNASMGRLLKDIDLKVLLDNVTVINISPIGRQLLNHVIANALTFYKK